MTINEAAESLHNWLWEEPWFNMVGVGGPSDSPSIYLYVKKLKGISFRGKEHEGHPVIVKKMGTLKPASADGGET